MRSSSDAGYLSFRTRDLPTTLWVELTSKCPFDCVFCSRKTRHGTGEHMDFGLYAALLGQLEQPEVIRLNYSGESAHYPRLEEAIGTAKETGARIELVTALASASPAIIEGMVRAGLDQITISLHAADQEAFRDVYRFSCLAALRERLNLLVDLSRSNRGRPVIDFAFVAMDSNIDQLPGVATLARRCGVRRLLVQPVAYRDPIPYAFIELDAERRIQGSFKSRLQETISAVRRRIPSIDLIVTDPDAGECAQVSDCPSPFPASLPRGARIFSCTENPWETIHIRANGDVVTCGWRVHQVVGNLVRQSLREIWQGETYFRFRQNYMEGHDVRCRSCHFKQAYRPGPPLVRLTPADTAPQQFVSGWYAGKPRETCWSGKSAKLVLGRSERSRTLYLQGQLPAGEEPNRLRIQVDRNVIGEIKAQPHSKIYFEIWTTIDRPAREPLLVEFETDVTVVPARDFGGKDERKLGFWLDEIAVDERWREPRVRRVVERARLPWRLQLLDLCVAGLDRFGKLLESRRRTRRTTTQLLKPGVTVIIPERDNRAVLFECLRSLDACRRGFPEPFETLVVVNGAALEEYSELGRQFPWVRWLHRREPLGFTGAVRIGLYEAAYDWVYLLNSDMMLNPDALESLLPHRAPDLFAIGSQIHFVDEDRPREESNLINYRIVRGLVEIFHRAPNAQEEVVPTLFAGGGSSLFRRDLLRRFIGTRDPYYPFYFEDAEWGTRAHREGYRVIFCASSHCRHVHRATVRQFYAEAEVQRIFERNCLKYQLRNWLHPDLRHAALRAIAASERQTRQELTSARAMASVLLGRWEAWRAGGAWTAPPGAVKFHPTPRPLRAG